jgi:hypothetical protein
MRICENYHRNFRICFRCCSNGNCSSGMLLESLIDGRHLLAVITSPRPRDSDVFNSLDMFVPRQVKRQASTTKAKRCHPAATVAQPNESHREQRPAKRQRVSELSATKAAQTTVAAGSENNIYYEEIRCGLESLLSDYAYTEPESRRWILERERQVDGDRGCVSFWHPPGI